MKSINAHTKLHEIIATKQVHLEAKKAKKPYSQLEQELQALPSFKGPSFFEALKSDQAMPKIIAEVKKASPSKGVISRDFSLAAINEAYQAANNVVAISVLTEEDYFQGSDEVLEFFAANNTNNKPLLRKDFIFDPYQVLESKLLGAQAYLLIAALLEADELNELVDLGQKIGIEPLVEVHDKAELKLAKSTNARVIGVNCRDLKTFMIDSEVHELLKSIDDSYARIAESAIDSKEYLKYVSAFCDAALIGSYFMSHGNIADAIKEMAA